MGIHYKCVCVYTHTLVSPHTYVYCTGIEYRVNRYYGKRGYLRILSRKYNGQNRNPCENRRFYFSENVRRSSFDVLLGVLSTWPKNFFSAVYLRGVFEEKKIHIRNEKIPTNVTYVLWMNGWSCVNHRVYDNIIIICARTHILRTIIWELF